MTDYFRDVGFYGTEMGGLVGGLRVRKRGLTSVVLGWTPNRGGTTEGGLLGAMDFIREPSRSGLTDEWYTRLRAVWVAANPDWALKTPAIGTVDANGKDIGYWDWDIPEYFERNRCIAPPDFGRQVTDAMLQGSGLDVIQNIWITKVEEVGNGAKVYLDNGDTWTCKAWVDVSYELDLARMSGVSIDYGRDSVSTFNEPLEVAGTRSAYGKNSILVTDAKGNLWPTRQMRNVNPLGTADALTMGYVFRMTISTHPNRLPFIKPPGYRREDFEWFTQLGKNYNRFQSISSYKRIGEHLYGTNGPAMPGLCWEYPWTGTRAERLAFWDKYYYYQMGMYWTAMTDPAFSDEMHADMRAHGLPHDHNQLPGQYYGTRGWSSQLYVREAARMVHDKVITARHILNLDGTAMNLPDPIGMHGYGMDSHSNRTYPLKVSEGRGSAQDGHLAVTGEGLYQIGLSHVKAPKSQAPRLLVSWGFSQSQAALCSSRIEPPAMMMGEICGLIASLAVENDMLVADVPYSMVLPELIAQGHPLTGLRNT